MNYYLITNVATLKACTWAQNYPYHMVLAQVLYRDAEYRRLVKRMIEKGAQVILDNGAHEAVVCSMSEYFQLAQNLKPWCVVLPDLIGTTAVESRTRSLVFYRWLKRYGATLPTMMYVPQGRCQREIVDDYLHMVEFFDDKDTEILIGMGDAYKSCYLTQHQEEDPEGVKIRLYQAMVSEVESSGEYKFHILGGRPIPNKFWSLQPRIVGLDSVDPCRCAIGQLTYPQQTEFYLSLTDDRVAEENLLRANVKSFCEAYGTVPAIR